MKFSTLQSKMFKAAGADEELRRQVAGFLLAYVRGGVDDALAYLQDKPEVNRIFAQVTK